MKFKYEGWKKVVKHWNFESPKISVATWIDRDTEPRKGFMIDQLYCSHDNNGVQIRFGTNFGKYSTKWLLTMELSYHELSVLFAAASQEKTMRDFLTSANQPRITDAYLQEMEEMEHEEGGSSTPPWGLDWGIMSGEDDN